MFCALLAAPLPLSLPASGGQTQKRCTTPEARGRDGVGTKVMETGETTPTADSPQDAQRESRRQLRILVDALPLLVAYVDAEARYPFTNRAHREWYGYAPGEIRGKSMRAVLGNVAYSIIETHFLS